MRETNRGQNETKNNGTNINEQTKEWTDKQKNEATKVEGEEISGGFKGTGHQSAAHAGSLFKFVKHIKGIK